MLEFPYSCWMANTPQRHATAVTGQRISEASCNMQVQLSGCEELQPCEVLTVEEIFCC